MLFGAVGTHEVDTEIASCRMTALFCDIEDHPLRVGRPRYVLFCDSPGCQLPRIAAVRIHDKDRLLLETIAGKLADTAESDSSSIGENRGSTSKPAVVTACGLLPSEFITKMEVVKFGSSGKSGE